MEKITTLYVTRSLAMDERPDSATTEYIDKRIRMALEVACAYIRDSAPGVFTSYCPPESLASTYKINAIKALRYVHPTLGLKETEYVVDLVLEAAQNPEWPVAPTDTVAKALS